jgi:hypothetical protein
MGTQSSQGERYEQITIVGAGLAGLVAAIACAEAGAPVRVIEAHDAPGGRARSDDGPYKANFGPHALYNDGPLWKWLHERDVLPECAPTSLAGVRLRWQGDIRRTPPLGMLPAVLRLRGRKAPVELDFRSWVAGQTDDRVASLLSGSAGVYTFYHDPGGLSAAFVWPRTVRVLLSPPPVARYPIGGWGALVDSLHARARKLGVVIELGHKVDSLPQKPVILSTELNQAAELLGEDLTWLSSDAVCLDVAVRRRRGDPFVVADLDEAGWIERFTANDRTLAPEGEELIQAQMPIRPGESADQAGLRLERLIDATIQDWRERLTWRRRQVMISRTGALDPPGSSWRDRPAVDRGEGVFLAGDMVAAPGLLSEVSWASAIEASRLALNVAKVSRGHLRKVA